MLRTLTIRNRQRVRAVDLRRFRRIVETLLTDLLKQEHADLGIHLLGTAEMTGLNETFLRHRGPTDVIAFDYTEPAAALVKARKQRRLAGPGRALAGAAATVHGEIFICVDEAVRQARRFRTHWPAELVRYAIHGILHLLGHDDGAPAARRKMKREEDRLLRELVRRFPLSKG